MNFNGWVKLRRGVMEHVQDGRLTGNEFTVLILLILIADAATGGGIINGAMVMYWTGYQMFSQDTARRILTALHEKGYIWYRSSKAKAGQRYFVNNYLLTRGPKTGRMTDLSQLREREGISIEDVLNCARHSQGDEPDDESGLGMSVVAAVHRTNNNTENDKENEKDTETNARTRVSATSRSRRKGGSEVRSHSGQPQSPVTQPEGNTDSTGEAGRPPASDAARRLAAAYLPLVATPKRHATAAETSWPVIFDRLLADRTEADLTAIISWAWEDGFWGDKMDRSTGDPVEYLAEKIEALAEGYIRWQRGRERYERQQTTTTPETGNDWTKLLHDPFAAKEETTS